MVFMLLMARLVNGYLVIMGIMASPVFRPLLGKKKFVKVFIWKISGWAVKNGGCSDFNDCFLRKLVSILKVGHTF